MWIDQTVQHYPYRQNSCLMKNWVQKSHIKANYLPKHVWTCKMKCYLFFFFFFLLETTTADLNILFCSSSYQRILLLVYYYDDKKLLKNVDNLLIKALNSAFCFSFHMTCLPLHYRVLLYTPFDDNVLSHGRVELSTFQLVDFTGSGCM